MWVNLDIFSIYYERQSVKTRKKEILNNYSSLLKKNILSRTKKNDYIYGQMLYTQSSSQLPSNIKQASDENKEKYH